MIERFVLKLSSWWTQTGLWGCFGLSYIWFMRDGKSFGEWKGFLVTTPAGLFFSCCLVLTLILISVRIVIQKLGGRGNLFAEISSLEMSFTLPVSNDAVVDGLSARLKQRGLAPIKTDAGFTVIWGRYSFIPGTLVRAGLVLLIAAFILSAHLRKTEDRILHEGDRAVFHGTEYPVTEISPGLPSTLFLVGDEPFTVQKASVLLQRPGRLLAIGSGYPSFADRAYFRLINIGYSHEVKIHTKGKGFAARADLSVFPPGEIYGLNLPEAPPLLFMLLPDKTITKGILKGKEYNLENPRFEVVLGGTAGEKDTVKGTVTSGGDIALGPATRVSLGPRTYFATVRSVRDPALPIGYAGVILFICGTLCMVSRFFWYRRELIVVCEKKVLYVGYRTEFFRKWSMIQFRRWKDEITDQCTQEAL